VAKCKAWKNNRSLMSFPLKRERERERKPRRIILKKYTKKTQVIYCANKILFLITLLSLLKEYYVCK
jgi:hypothetical protein